MLCRACGDAHPDGTAVCPRMEEPTPVTAGPCQTQIDRYLIERFIGGGGMGAVYRARHVMLDQLMALKLLKAGLAEKKEVLERFVREARAAAAIGNPHIVRVSDFGIAPDGRAFLAMELLDGRDLEATIRAGGPLEPGRAVGIALQVLDGLGAAHAAGIVHRDLKPANVFLLPVAGGELVKLVDFGVSKMGMGAHMPSLTQTGSVVGTPLYMAPEQFRGAKDIDHRADLYALGVTMYEMLSAKPPWDAPTYESLILAIYSDPPRPLRELAPSVPPPLEAVIQRALARDPAARFASADEMAQALRAAAAAARLVVPAAPIVHPSSPGMRPPSFVGASTVPAQKKKSRGLLWAALLLGVAGTGIAIAVAIGTSAPAEPSASASASATASAAPTPPPTPSPVTAPPPPPDAAPLPPPDAPAAPDAPPNPNPNPNPHPNPPPPPPPPPKPRPADTVRIDEPRVVGDLDVAPLDAAIDKVRAQLEKCRLSDKTEKVQVQFHVAFGDIHLAAPAADNTGPPNIANCIANRVRGAHPKWPNDQSGILIVEVTVAARP